MDEGDNMSAEIENLYNIANELQVLFNAIDLFFIFISSLLFFLLFNVITVVVIGKTNFIFVLSKSNQ